MKKKKKTYRNISINENLSLVIREKGAQKLMSLGFPFPIESYELKNIKSKKDTSILISLRGEKIRKFQKNQLITELEKIKEVEYVEINSIQAFRKLVTKICENYRKINYYDPYSFLGDSYIGLYFLEKFIEKFRFKLNTIYSENYLNLRVVGRTKGYISNLKSEKRTLNLFLDVLDNQWNRTKYLVKKLTKQNTPSIILGRDLVVLPDKLKIRIFHFNRKNVLLKEKNIEDYMDECLDIFFKYDKKKPFFEKKFEENILINPFGSDQIKTIPLEIILDLINHFSKAYPNSKIILISGFKNSYSHILYISKLKGGLKKENKNVIFKNFGSFSEIYQDVIKYKISLGLTADTSISHLLNFLKIRNITFFNLERCDLESPQSLSSDSPLGFCRFGNMQYPALFNKRVDKKLKRGVILAADYFFKKTRDLSWCKSLFDEKILINNLPLNKYSSLRSANEKINPLFKIKND